MSASNLTDIVKSLINSTRNNSIIIPVSTWETRLQAKWQHLFGYSIGSVLCILIICISIFSKHITGDYKWLILNQALANFFGAIGTLAYTLVVYIWYTEREYYILHSGDAPLWINIFHEATLLLRYCFGRYATMTTLFATVFNRWMAIALPDHYQKFMSARLIVLYCTLCYVVTIPTDMRFWSMLNISDEFALILEDIGFYLIPWLLSIILSVIIFFKLWSHMRNTTTLTDKRRLQESRMVLYSLMIQIAVHFLERIPDIVMLIVMNVVILRGSILSKSLLSLLSVCAKMADIFNMYTNAISCVVILITMRPYRRALLSLISPITRFCLHHLKLNVTPKTTDNRVTTELNVGNVQPARRTKVHKIAQ